MLRLAGFSWPEVVAVEHKRAKDLARLRSGSGYQNFKYSTYIERIQAHGTHAQVAKERLPVTAGKEGMDISESFEKHLFIASSCDF
mmetsp:Transcript_11341/g.47291  ORF Transcript_11341/g.47291 Transcript_11341/m.47291 type:complete len:86 (-) Transcript_11341:3881-4138(-)